MIKPQPAFIEELRMNEKAREFMAFNHMANYYYADLLRSNQIVLH